MAPGYGCPCFSRPDTTLSGFSGFPQLGDRWMSPGDIRELGYVFLVPEVAVPEFKKAGKFYLWDGGIVGEAEILEMPR
ncbi:MAG: hypothetical protein HKN36_06580 [Hellea sp.]|nr:hypothetical protein [Hellea sp.]